MRCLATAAVLLLPFLASAQSADGVVNIATPQTLSVKRGQTAQQKLQISLRSGFHVNSDKPRDEFLIPIKLTWTSGPLQTKQISYPKPEDVKVGDDTLSVFTGKFTIDTEFLAPPQAQAGIATMQGKLRYQACDSRSCKRPATVAVQVPVSIQ
jgi:hypothetical protein